nr:fatty acyl-CoA reductase 1-like [Nomia melanderi]
MTSDRSDTYMNNTLDPPESEMRKSDAKSEIAEFYTGTNILITGGTGFLGTLLIEKLLRSCPGITTIYMLIRPKKGKASKDRFEEIFNDVIYERLKQEQPNFLNKIVMIEGDAAKEDFGLTPETKTMLTNTNIIFHVAATVRFNEKIRLAVHTNVRVTKNLLVWAKQLSNIKFEKNIITIKSLTKSEQELDLSPEEKVPIYNIVSTCQNPITWNRFMKLNENFGYEVPTIKMYWYYMFIFNRYLLLHELSIFFFHIVPAFIVDTLARLIGRPPVLLDTYKKIHKAMDALQFFLGRQWIFENENVVKLWKKLNSVDQKTFNFNMENLDWEIYFYHYIRGVRFYILKDTFDTIKEARIKLTRLFIAHYSIIIVVSLLLLWTTVSFVNFLWSYCPLSH